MRGFAHIDTWIFDLDNTLYPASCRLFDQIDVRIGAFVSRLLDIDAAEAKRIQKAYFYEYGTTLRGLMSEHQVVPQDFLDYVHDIDHSPVPANQLLDEALHALPGRKLIFTNGTVTHARKVLARIGVTHHFGDIFDIVHSDYIPKPAIGPYRKFIAETGIDREDDGSADDDLKDRTRELATDEACASAASCSTCAKQRCPRPIQRTLRRSFGPT